MVVFVQFAPASGKKQSHSLAPNAVSLLRRVWTGRGGLSGRANWDQAKAFLIGTMGIEASALPADLATYDRRMQAAEALRNKMDALTQSQQQDMVDLQSIVNRRDVAHSTASNIVRALATSTSADAANF